MNTLSNVQWELGHKWAKKDLSKLNITGEDARAGWSLVQSTLRMIVPGALKPEEHRILEDTSEHLIVKRTAWCPVLEACETLGLSTREICPHYTVEYANGAIQTLNPKLHLEIGKIRPKDKYCEYIVHRKP